MNYTFTEHKSDPNNDIYSFTFTGLDSGYIEVSNIIIEFRTIGTLDWYLYSNNVTLESVNAVVIPTKDIPPAPTDGKANLRVRRVMPKDKPYAEWNAGQDFTDFVINNSFLQQLYTMHEVLDGFIGRFNVNIDMQGHKITGVEVDWDDPKSVANVESMLEVIAISEESVGKASAYTDLARDWAIKANGMVDDGVNEKDYSSKKYASDSKDEANIAGSFANEAEDWSDKSKIYSEESNKSALLSGDYSDKAKGSAEEAKKQAKEATKQATLAGKHEAEMKEIYLGIRSDFPSGYPQGAWMLHNGTLALAGSYNYIGVDMNINNGWIKAVQDKVDLTKYMRNDITVGPVITITSPEWYGEQGVGFQCMSSPESLGLPIQGEYFYLNKTNARNRLGGSVWSATTNTIRDTYIGEIGESSSYLVWKKMLHEGCETLVGQLPSTSITLTRTETHLDTLKDAGLYHQDYTSGATTENGYPFNSAGSLQVIKSAGITQVYTEYQAPFRVARRSYVQSKWSAWFIDTVTWEYKGTAMQGEEVALNDAFGTPIFEDNAFGLSYYLTLMVGYASATSFQEVHVVNFLFTGESIFNTSTSGIYLQYVNGTAVIEIMLKGVVVGTHLKYIVNLKEIGHSKTPSLNNKNATNNNTIKTLEFNENKQEKEDDESINDITAFGSIGRM